MHKCMFLEKEKRGKTLEKKKIKQFFHLRMLLQVGHYQRISPLNKSSFCLRNDGNFSSQNGRVDYKISTLPPNQEMITVNFKSRID